MFYTNCDCLTQTKKSELEALVSTDNPDIIALTEILPKTSLFDTVEEFYNLEGYTKIVPDLNEGRGIIIYVRANISVMEVTKIADFHESVWCKIRLKSKDILIIGCIYRSPNSMRQNSLLLFDMIKEISGMRYSMY